MSFARLGPITGTNIKHSSLEDSNVNLYNKGMSDKNESNKGRRNKQHLTGLLCNCEQMSFGNLHIISFYSEQVKPEI